MTTNTPRDVWLEARDLLDRLGGDVVGWWPRGVALLARQALEGALDDLWRKKAPSLEACTMRAQLLCLPAYLPDDEAAHAASHLFSALSRACHHRVYELAPSWTELDSWIRGVERVLDAVERAM